MPESLIVLPPPIDPHDVADDVAEGPTVRTLYDFCLMDYDVPAPTGARLASESLLHRTWRLAGVHDEAAAITERLQARLGRHRTVWGAKYQPERKRWSWELYFYRRDHTPADLSPALVAACIAPLRLAQVPGADVGWTFFSIGFDGDDLRQGREVAFRLYIECRNLSWRIRPEGLELENHYTVYEGESRLPAMAKALRASPHVPRHPLAIARVLPPPLHRSWRIWLASKRTCETVYVQRIETGDLLEYLRLREWPVEVTDWLHARAHLMGHVLWDASLDFRRAPARQAGEPDLHVLKSACYACL
jgi:hypothetical protein